MIRSIVSLLTVAVAASTALANGGEDEKKNAANPYQSGSVSWKPGSGITLADAEEFGLTLSGLLQVQYSFSALDNAAPDVSTFAVRFARVGFTGHVWNKDLAYTLVLDAVDTGPPVKDAWAQWTFCRGEDCAVGLRAGQGKPYYGLEFTGALSAPAHPVRDDVLTRAGGLGPHQAATLRRPIAAEREAQRT